MVTNYTEWKWEAQLEWSQVYRQEPRRLEKICRQPLFLLLTRHKMIFTNLWNNTESSANDWITWLSCCLLVRHTTHFTRRERGIWRWGWYDAHYKHVRALLKINNFFKKIAVTVDVQKISRLLSNYSVLKYTGPDLLEIVMAHHTTPHTHTHTHTHTHIHIFSS
jgi:hypothetical protein